MLSASQCGARTPLSPLTQSTLEKHLPGLTPKRFLQKIKTTTADVGCITGMYGCYYHHVLSVNWRQNAAASIERKLRKRMWIMRRHVKKENIINSKEGKIENFLAKRQKKNTVIIIVQHRVAIVANKFINENDKQQMGFGTKIRPENLTQLKFEYWIFEINIIRKKLKWYVWTHICNRCKQITFQRLKWKLPIYFTFGTNWNRFRFQYKILTYVKFINKYLELMPSRAFKQSIVVGAKKIENLEKKNGCKLLSVDYYYCVFCFISLAFDFYVLLIKHWAPNKRKSQKREQKNKLFV